MAVSFVATGLLICVCATYEVFGDDNSFRKDYTFYESANGWMKLHLFPANWADARFACHLEGAVLASPLNDGILSTMESIVTKANKKIYTGVHSMSSTLDYASSDGVPLKYLKVKWAPDQPNNTNNNERCIAMSPMGMDDVECSSVFHYLCYKKKIEGEKFETNECGVTDSQYKKNNLTGSCYKAHPTTATWYRAYTVCNSEGGYLAIINSQMEAEVLAGIADRFPRKPEETLQETFIGFYGWPNSNSWPDMKPIYYSTVDGRSLEDAGYARWSLHVSQNAGLPEMCGTIQLRKHELQGVSTAYCYDSHPFICEIDKPLDEKYKSNN